MRGARTLAFARIEAILGVEVREWRGLVGAPVVERHRRLVQAVQAAELGPRAP